MGYELGIIGAGKIGEAVAVGAVARGFVAKEKVLLSVRSERHRAELEARTGIRTVTDNLVVARECPNILLAVKPKTVAEVVAQISPALGPDKLLVSTAAGKVSRLTKTATAGDLGSHRTTAVLSGPALTDAGEAVLATDADLVRSDLYLLLSTGKTERVMRPHMGSMLSSLVYSVADASTLKDEISAEISRLLAASNLGVTLLSCAVAVDERTVLVTLQLARPGIPQFDLALNYARL